MIQDMIWTYDMIISKIWYDYIIWSYPRYDMAVWSYRHDRYDYALLHLQYLLQIRRNIAWEAGASRHHRPPIKGSFKTPLIPRQYGTEGCELGPTVPGGMSVYDGQSEIHVSLVPIACSKVHGYISIYKIHGYIFMYKILGYIFPPNIGAWALDHPAPWTNLEQFVMRNQIMANTLCSCMNIERELLCMFN